MTTLEIVFLIALLVSLVLHAVAPRTKTKLDDEAAKVADEVVKELGERKEAEKAKQK